MTAEEGRQKSLHFFFFSFPIKGDRERFEEEIGSVILVFLKDRGEGVPFYALL